MKGLAATAALVLGIACTEPKADPNACQRGYGFGNYGCAEVAGSVLNAANQPIANASIYSGTSTDPFDFTQTTTDATGAFRLRLNRRWLAQSASSDTASAWVHAVIPLPTTGPATAHDSAKVLLNFYPIGKRPVASTVTIHLP